VTISLEQTMSLEPQLSLAPHHLTLKLPVPPSINHQYATVQGRRVLSAPARRYKTAVANHVLHVLAHAPHRQSLLRTLRTHHLALTIRFFFASLLRRDVDSGLKIVQDAICEALGMNDNRIVELHLYKAQDTRDPHVEVTLNALARKT
jgi:crossover junction endodeoxyribonuclease RusA